jgi:hypothetical protein
MLDMFLSGLMFQVAGLAFSGAVVLVVYNARRSRDTRANTRARPVGRALCV